MTWAAHAERAERRFADGETRLQGEPDARQKQLVRMAMAAGSAGLARLMDGRDDKTSEWFLRSAECYRSSWAGAPPGSWGRPIGALKAVILAGDMQAAVETATWAASLEAESSDSAIGRYAAALAALALGRDDEAASHAAGLAADDSFPAATAAALVALAWREPSRYREALAGVLHDFESRTTFLEDLPVADTVLVLEALAERRGLAARPTSALLPRAAANLEAMREDLRPGQPFPDLRLPDHTERERSLSELAARQPLVLCFVRGWWCPKEQVRLRNLVDLQEEIQREYGRLVAVTVDEPYVNGAFRAGLGAGFPFLSDVGRKVGRELDLLELSDAKHEPVLPFTFVLDSRLVIHRVWLGFWYWGNPTPDELRLALREITAAEQPTFEAQQVWADGGSAPPAAGIRGDVVWIREDAEGREIQRGIHEGEIPAEGDEVGRSEVDGRPWLVHRVDQDGGRPAIHLRKGGTRDTSRTVRHSISAPR